MFINFLYILLAIAVLLILITVHEFGHYIAGKLLKFKINEFSIGFGPAVFSKKIKSGEKFSLRVIPLGGYCAFEGEDEENPSPAAFNNQKPWKRLIVLFAGVFFNFVFGVIIAVVFLAISAFGVPQIAASSPNNTNGFLVGDVITEVNGKKLQIYRTLPDVVSDFEIGEEFNVIVERDGEEVELTVAKYAQSSYRYIGAIQNLEGIVFDSEGNLYSQDDLKLYIENTENSLTGLYKEVDGEYVAYTETEITELASIQTIAESDSLGIIYGQFAKKYNFGQALVHAFPFCIYICGLILSALGGLFVGSTAISEVGGTITAVSQIAEISKISFASFLLLIPLLSMNLAVFNLLPIPALDGARMVFVTIEWIRGKPINRKVEGYIHMIGLIVLFSLVIFLDIYHFFILK